VSLEEPINRVLVSVPEWSPDDLTLQIHVRLCPDGDAQPIGDSGLPCSEHPPTATDLAQLAYGIYCSRRKRDRMLLGELFGEPAWDMMLALYCFPARGEKLGVTSLSYAANIPTATGHRVQAALTAHGLIERSQQGSDRRMQYVNLTEKGRMLLERYLRWLFDSKTVTQPYLAVAAPSHCL